MHDNSGTIKWASGHPVEEFQRSKHIKVTYHQAREKILGGEIHVEQMSTSEMAADFLTMAMNGDQVTKANARKQLVEVPMAHKTKLVSTRALTKGLPMRSCEKREALR